MKIILSRPSVSAMKKQKKLFNYLLACAVIVSSFVMSISVAQAGLSGKPAGNPYSSIARSWFIYELVPGSVINDAVEIVNTGNETQTSHLYPADAISSNTGNFALKQKDEEMNDVGSWISISKSEITLAPGTSEVVPFTISVPASGVDVGEHSGGIVVASASPQTLKENNGAPGINLTLRAATRVYITIPGELNRNVELLATRVNASQMRNYTLPFNLYPELSLLKVPKTYKVQADLKNSGNVGTPLKLTLKGANVITGENINEQVINPKLERDRKSTQVFEWVAPVIGFYEFYVEGEYNKATSANASADIQKFVSEKMTVWVIPWDLILAFTFVLIALILLYMARRSYFSTKGWVPYKITAKDTLKSIASVRGISWKRLAIANKISAPYSLNEIDKLLVPPTGNEPQVKTISKSKQQNTKKAVKSVARARKKPTKKTTNKASRMDKKSTSKNKAGTKSSPKKQKE